LEWLCFTHMNEKRNTTPGHKRTWEKSTGQMDGLVKAPRTIRPESQQCEPQIRKWETRGQKRGTEIVTKQGGPEFKKKDVTTAEMAQQGPPKAM